MALLGIDPMYLYGILIFSIMLLLLILIFIFLGIKAFVIGGTFGAVINSTFPILGGLGLSTSVNNQ